MNGLVLHPDSNTPGKHDASGAFIPEALAFARLHGIPGGRVLAFPFGAGTVPMAQRRRWALDTLRRQVPMAPMEVDRLRVLALFCHGYRRGVQAGLTVPSVDALASVLAERSRKDLIVALYCCDTARDADPDRADDLLPGPGGDGGFADELRDALCRAGLVDCRVYGHTVVGHTTRAPWVRLFAGEGSREGGQGGHYIVRPRGLVWPKWRRALAETDLRLRYPFLSLAELHEELGSR